LKRRSGKIKPYSHRQKKLYRREFESNQPMSQPLPAFLRGTKAITLTPVVGAPRREYAEMFILGEEALEDGELIPDSEADMKIAMARQ
jgi:hypothetical protein